MKGFSFIYHYITKPRTVGAVVPSSRYLARKMVADIDFTKANCIVEYGPGTGAFTKEILQRRRDGTVVVAIERNADFCALLRQRFAGEDNLHIINGSAEKIGGYLSDLRINKADYIVSGLPFASLPAETSVAILANARAFLDERGRFITFQYSMLRKGLFSRFFTVADVKREWRNLPPAYVLSCTAKNADT